MLNILKIIKKPINLKMKIVIICIITLFCIISLIQIVNNTNKINDTNIDTGLLTTSGEARNSLENRRYNLVNSVITKDNIIVNSEEIALLINNREKSAREIFGNTDKMFNEEYVYQNRNLRIRDSFGKVSYLILTNGYSKTIVNDIKITDTKEAIAAKLQIDINSIDNEGVTLKNKDIYIHINIKNKNVVVFLNEKEDLTKFIELVKEFTKTKDYMKFIPEVTKNYPRYSNYEYGSRKIVLIYPTLGIKINVSNSENSLEKGIYIYSNNDEVREFQSIEENSKSEKIFFENEDLVILESIDLIEKTNLLYETNYSNTDNLVTVNYENSNLGNNYINVKVIPFNKSIIPYNLNKAAVADSIIIKNEKIYYSLNGDGIFVHDFIKNTTNQLVILNTEVELNRIENNILVYNKNKTINI